MLKAIIFDMDGVLVNSVDAVWKSFAVLLKNDGVHFSDDYIRKNLARSLRDNLRAWKSEFGVREYDVMDFSRKAGALQLEMLKTQNIDQHLLRLLKSARERGVRCAVATSSLRWRAEKILNLLGMRTFFNSVVTAEDVERHKPAPDVFAEAARQLNIRPAECVVIEDAGNGIDAARNAGMKTVGIATKYHSVKELQHADIVINSFADIDIDRLGILAAPAAKKKELH